MKMWIISGPSSVGKSTFIESDKAVKITTISKEAPVIFPKDQIGKVYKLNSDFYMHYNILRPCHMIEYFQQTSSKYSRLLTLFFRKLFATEQQNGHWDHIKGFWNYEIDTKWVEIAHADVPKKAIVLVTNLNTLLKRVKNRKIIEKNCLNYNKQIDYTPPNYSSKFWLDVYSTVNLYDIYKTWCEELSRQNIDYILINSSDDSYPIVHSIEDLSIILLEDT